MSPVETNQPLGTPVWIDLAVPDLDRARVFYGAVFSWEFDGGDCLLRGVPVAGLHHTVDPTPGWQVYLATDDCAGTAEAVAEAGGTLLREPHDVGDRGRAALAVDPSSARFGLWEGHAFPGSCVVNEPDTLVRNDLVTPGAAEAREFYCTVFGFTLDGNDDLPDADFTFLRRPDGHEVGGIFALRDAPTSAWATTFEVADADTSATKVRDAGGEVASVAGTPYGRMATVTDPFGTGFTLIARP